MPGASRRYQDHRLLLVLGCRWIALAHDNGDFQWVSRAPEDHHLRPLMTYSSPSRETSVSMLVASLEATLGLGHGETRADLALQQWLQPLLLLPVGAVSGQHLLVAGVRRGAAEHFRGKRRAAHDLAKRGRTPCWSARRRTRSPGGTGSTAPRPWPSTPRRWAAGFEQVALQVGGQEDHPDQRPDDHGDHFHGRAEHGQRRVEYKEERDEITTVPTFGASSSSTPRPARAWCF